MPPRLLIESDDAVAKEGSFALIGNGRLYGGPFPFFKHALIDDGLFDVILFKQLGYLEIIKYLQNVVFTSAITLPEVEYFQTRRLSIDSEEEVPVELDGELSRAVSGAIRDKCAASSRSRAAVIGHFCRFGAKRC